MTEKKSKIPFYLIDPGSEFYRPVGIRIAICAVAAMWLGIELLHRDGFFLVLSSATLLYCVYILFLTYKPPEPKSAVPTDRSDDDSEEDEERKD